VFDNQDTKVESVELALDKHDGVCFLNYNCNYLDKDN